uniref:Uncharacterized protein n=1 Tax=Mesocestoides corti TaxID=53468 RepID=A0A5K3FJI2_MESCO
MGPKTTVATDQGADILQLLTLEILCLSAVQWQARKISSQPEKDTNEMQYLLSGASSVVHSHE